MMKLGKSKDQHLSGKIYSFSLLIFLVIAFIIYFTYLPNNSVWLISTILVTVVIHFAIYLIVALFINLGEERPFVKQYNQVMEEYEKTNDPQELYQGLININFTPTKIETKNAYNLSISTALHRLNRTQEALTYLDKINTKNPELAKIVEEQKKYFKSKKK